MKKQLYVLTGFLGAGKTSLLLHLLDHMPDRKIGIIQNEFGKLGVDGQRLSRSGITMTEIGRGSIFCSCLKLTFVQALAEMGKTDVEQVYVESSGLADPSNLEEILDAVRVLAGDVYELRGVICLVDAVNFQDQLQDVATVDRQLAHCHMALINKIDLVEEDRLEQILALVRSVNPLCLVQTCVNGRIDPATLEADLLAHQWAACDASTNTIDNKPKTFSLECEEPVSGATLRDFLRMVQPECYRIKGDVLLEEGWHQVDMVEKLVDYVPCQPRELTQLVFLSKVGPKLIRTVDAAWKVTVCKPMRLKN